MIIGIDPGLKGAIAQISNRGKIRQAVPTPTLNVTKTKHDYDEHAIRDILSPHVDRPSIHVFIEKVGAMPGQGVTSMFNFGAGWGLVRGICVGLGLPYTLVHPATWKKTMCRDMPKDTKQVSVIVAKRLWPGVNLLRTERSRKPDDGLADALLIAEWGRRSLNGAQL